jgi:tripartite-type tricarboxylate transporter receptor subunit TctC
MRMAVLAVAAAAVLSSVATAHAEWPDRPIKMIVPFPAGSSSDTVGRIVAAKMGERLGQQIVVENRPGGSTIIGTDAVAKSAPDGYIIELANTTTHAASVALNATLPFDPVKDFAPVAMIGSSPFVLVSAVQLDVKTLKDLVALAKAKPGKLSYASAGTGTLAHLAGELFKHVAGVDITHVPYRGSGQSMLDLLQGRIYFSVSTIPPTLQSIREGKLRALATTGPARNAMLPDLPTLAEAGLPGYEAGLWTGFVFPAGVSPAIVAKLNTAVNAVIKDHEVIDLLMKQGVETESGGPDVLATRIKADLAKWRDLVTKAGIKAQ